jgi:hypothetical protein
MIFPADSVDPTSVIRTPMDSDHVDRLPVPHDQHDQHDGYESVGFDGPDGVRIPDDFVHRLLSHTDGRISTEQARRLTADLANLERWLESLPVIEQAKGILMAHYGIDAGTAFNVLRRWSSHHNVKIRTISQRLAAAASHQQSDDDESAGTGLGDVIAVLNSARPE